MIERDSSETAFGRKFPDTLIKLRTDPDLLKKANGSWFERYVTDRRNAQIFTQFVSGIVPGRICRGDCSDLGKVLSTIDERLERARQLTRNREAYKES